jgi:hypothetical protein
MRPFPLEIAGGDFALCGGFHRRVAVTSWTTASAIAFARRLSGFRMMSTGNVTPSARLATSSRPVPIGRICGPEVRMPSSHGCYERGRCTKALAVEMIEMRS